MSLAPTAAPTLPATDPDDQAEPTVPQEWLYRMSLEVYERICELGLIPKEEHVVLLDGLLIQTMNQSDPHYTAVDRGKELLSGLIPRGWYVRADGPIRLLTGPQGMSRPEPDLVVVIGSRRRYADHAPEVAEIGLLVEIASDADAFRVERKALARYAYAGIPTVWIVTLHDQRVHIYTEPSGPSEAPTYGQTRSLTLGETIEPVSLGGDGEQPPAILGPIAVASFFIDPDGED